MIWGGRWKGGSGVGTYVHPWWIHVEVWQNQYTIVNLKKKKVMGCRKSGAKREVSSNMSLPQETRETSNKQPIPTSIATTKKNKPPQS